MSCFPFCCLVCVDASQRGIVQKLGEFVRVAGPGPALIAWPIVNVSTVSMKVQQNLYDTDTKTDDDVTVKVSTAVQWQVDPDSVDKFFFELSEPERQIGAFVDDCVRGQLPHMTLDKSYESKTLLADEIADSIRTSLSPYGVKIIRVLITDLTPDRSVLQAMNEINAAKRLRVAAVDKAEAEKIVMVKKAEAEAETKYLLGVGTAKMRQAITDGYKTSIDNMKGSTGLEPKEVVHMMLVTQYMDVLKDFAVSGKSSLVLPGGPDALSNIENSIRNWFMSAKMAEDMQR